MGLLWCLALLSVLVIGLLHSTRLDLMVVKNHGDQIQAHYLALAGIEKAKALLHRDAAERRRSSRSHSGELSDAPQFFQDVALGRGRFRVFHQAPREQGGQIRYGVTDEESRLNVNTASAEELAKLYGMTPDIVAAIVDWRDEDNAVTPGGAEADYYASLRPPYLPRNGPFQSGRELRMVRGMTRELLAGEDANQNGLLDRAEDDGRDSFPPDSADGLLDAGCAELLTTESSVRNENAAGQERVNIQSADESSLSRVPGVTPELAKAIVAYRAQNRFENLADLLEVTAQPPLEPARPQPSPAASPAPAVVSGPSRAGRAAPPSSRPAAQSSGPRLVTEQLFMDIADDVTVSEDETQPGAINLNTASSDVLACLPGVSRELAQAIVAYRKSAGFFPNIAWLLKVDGMTREVFKQIAPKVSARSETYRILSEGRVTSTGARKRIEVVVRPGQSTVETLAYREDDL